MDRKRAVAVVRDLVQTVREEQVSFLAASIAYYLFVSVFPLLLLALVLASLIGGVAFANRVVGLSESVLSPEAADLVLDALTSAAGRGSATVLSLALMLWGGLKVFRGLDMAFSQIYGTSGEESFVGTVVDAVSALAGIGLALGGLAVIGSLGALFGVTVAFGGLALIPVLTVAFLPLYYLFPDADLSVREALPGALLAAFAWTVFGTVFSIYASQAGSFQLYGVIGGALLLVTYFYFAGQILLVGAAFNKVLLDDMDRQLQQEPLRRSSKAMSEDADRPSGETPPPDRGPDATTGAGDDLTDEELEQLRAEFESFRDDIEDRTLHRDDVKDDLKRYVRRRMRRGHARGWGPYVVLLYGTLMTLGAFYYLQDQAMWAVVAMLVVWLSTLGLYVLMVLVGVTFRVTGLPGRAVEAVRDWRE